MKKIEEKILNELKESDRVSRNNLSFKYFLFPWKVEEIMYNLTSLGCVITVIRYSDPCFKLMKDQNGVSY